ncbi:MAG: ABC-2 transporter permease [Clostridiales bacterium]|jgi:ABC-2 type transport system permease protein|nr:ABC-2 transporter permease [Clostridiales bacterium]
MIGLLRKDFLILRKELLLLLGVVLFNAIIHLEAKSSLSLVILPVVLGMVLSLASMAYDEKSKWDGYARSLPVTSKHLVLSKYLFGTCCYGGSVALMLPLLVLVDWLAGRSVTAMLPFLLSFSAIALFLMAVMFPIAFQIGVIKTRFVMVMVIILIAVVTGLLYSQVQESDIQQIFHSGLGVLCAVAVPAISVVSYVVSFWISVGIYRRKEV